MGDVFNIDGEPLFWDRKGERYFVLDVSKWTMGPKIIENGQKASINEKTTKIPDSVKYQWSYGHIFWEGHKNLEKYPKMTFYEYDFL